MNKLDLSSLSLDDPPPPLPNGALPLVPIPDDIAHTTDRYMSKLRAYAKSIPYSIEPNSKMQEMFEFILYRITQCVEAKDYQPGLFQWDSMVSYWMMLKYPIPKEKRIRLAKLYYQICITPGMPTHIIGNCVDNLVTLTRSRKKLSVHDMRLPWKPLYDILREDLFLRRRQFEISHTSWYMAYIAENTRRFYHPAAIDEMLSTFLPLMNGTSLSSILASQYYMLTFLPMSHPQSYLPMLFRVWESVNSYMYDERMIQFLSRLAEMHVDPSISDPAVIAKIPDDARSENEGRPNWAKEDSPSKWRWSGIQHDVGIFSEREFDYIMCKCLASMEIPLADAGSLSTGPSADGQATFELNRLPKPEWRIPALARLIVYSMAPDGLPTPGSNVSTPFFTPLASGASTPLPRMNGHPATHGGLADYLSAPLGKGGHLKAKTYLAGCKALDSLVRFIASLEGFFHPTNSGSWTNDLSAFIKYIVYEFNKRWHEEQLADCKTPTHRRLNLTMRRELVRSLRTVALLAMFSSDSTTVGNIQSCLKSMSVMEPDLILYPILERAVPALEALVETQRTTAMIKALGAVAPALVSRNVYYGGAKHLLPVLELLLPGIDLNDPYKTFCTTSFLVEVAQYIKFGEVSDAEAAVAADIPQGKTLPNMPKLDLSRLPDGLESTLDGEFSKEEEDSLLKHSLGGFADWIAAFLRRVILLFENLPDEATNAAGGQTEVQLVDSVSGAFSQICVHLSEPLYDMVLNLVFDYASGNVRSNAVRAIHQLVECVANVNPAKTLGKFLEMCSTNIRTELEHGASSLRTTSPLSTPLPADATLHWNLAILRGAMYNDGRATLLYKDQLLSLFKLLQKKTFSKRGFSTSGKLLSSTLLTLTHTYPLENKFVNPDEWESEEFRHNHHRYWGRLYKPEDVKLSWHVPTAGEIDFALQIFKEIVEPTLDLLDGLLKPGVVHDAIWRNDFCRHLSFVRNAFAGIPTFVKEFITPEDLAHAKATSDILHEIPEMIADILPLNSGFALDDASDPRHHYMTALKARFGQFLHNASVSLRGQGEENTVDAVHMLIRSIRTYMLEYGDSRDSYYRQVERYNSEVNITRQYAGQKEWPRAIYVRRARLYHAARLHWNSVDRRRGPLEDQLIDDVTEWCLWHYATIRESSQSLLKTLSNCFDGLRRRSLPVLYAALAPGSEDDRMKGALWTLDSNVFAKYAAGDPTLATEFVEKLFGCQHNEKPSIQDCVSNVAETALAAFAEPNQVVYTVENPELVKACEDLKDYLQVPKDDSIVEKTLAQRILRVKLWDEGVLETTRTTLRIAQSSETHWKYSIVAVRCLRTLIRRDTPMDGAHVKFLLEHTHDSNATIRYYAQRAVMKVSRFIKLRTLAEGPVDLALERSKNPLKRMISVENPSQEYTAKFLAQFRVPLDLDKAREEPLLQNQVCLTTGWLVWPPSYPATLAPDTTSFAFHPWEEGSKDAINVIREVCMKSSFWESLSTHYSSENHSEVCIQDNISCVKSIFQVLLDEPFEALRPAIEKLLADKEKNKQRGAAELIAGVLAGSKHWPTDKQLKLWEWFAPQIPKIFGQRNNDIISIWTSFLEYIFYCRDPRRVQPLVDHIIKEFNSADFNAETTSDTVRTLCYFRAMYEQLGWQFTPWVDDTLRRYWRDLTCEHDDVLAYISEFMTISGKIMWRPNSTSTAETFVKECKQSSIDEDVMGIRGLFHEGRTLELAKKFKTWREERLPGVRAFQSTYDRVGVLVCRWLFQAIHDTIAIATFDYILPLMSTTTMILLTERKLVLNRMCGVIAPRPLTNPILDAMFNAIQTSPSWRVRLKILPLVQVFYFRQGPVISDIKVVEMLEVICRCLDDEVVEVREMAATTLSGILRVSPRRSVLALKERFVRLLKNSHLPDRKSPVYNNALRQRHAAILGICALVDSYPYTVEKWMPDLLTNVLADHTYDPIPISATVRKCARNFRKTHQDTWHEDSKRFTEDQLVALSTLFTGSSYYA